MLEYHLSLGAGNTKLVEVVKRAGKVSGLKSSEKKEKILKFLSKTEDGEIIAGREKLIKNVPYRLQVHLQKKSAKKYGMEIKSVWRR